MCALSVDTMCRRRRLRTNRWWATTTVSKLGAVTNPTHDVVSDQPGRCVNANDIVERGDGDDGGERYYIGEPLHKHNAPARRAQTHATNTHIARARTMQTCAIAWWRFGRTGRDRAGRNRTRRNRTRCNRAGHGRTGLDTPSEKAGAVGGVVRALSLSR